MLGKSDKLLERENPFPVVGPCYTNLDAYGQSAHQIHRWQPFPKPPGQRPGVYFYFVRFKSMIFLKNAIHGMYLYHGFTLKFRYQNRRNGPQALLPTVPPQERAKSDLQYVTI